MEDEDGASGVSAFYAPVTFENASTFTRSGGSPRDSESVGGARKPAENSKTERIQQVRGEEAK